MKLAPGLHRIGSDIVAAYLVEDESGVTVVDAGLSGHWNELLDELGAMGRPLDDVRGLVLTHGDTDHVGFAERLRSERAVPVHAHEADAVRARGEVKKKVKMGSVKLGPLARFFWYGARRGGYRTTWLTEVVTVTDGQVLELPGSPRIVHIPGHTPGSIAVHVAAVDALLVGDAMTTGHVMTGAQGPQPAPFTLDPAQALASMARLEAIEARWVLPGHGPPWDRGSAEAVRLYREAAAAHPG
jgi:glyoxylase-like metal-dependent hydrolase (beta-lactamase superfamily II)